MEKVRYLLLFLVGVLINSIDAQDAGSPCTVTETQQPGVCSPVRDCPAVIALIQRRRSYTRCSFEGWTEVVCCPTPPPSTTTAAPRPLRISERKCVEYGEAVYDHIRALSLVAGTTGTTRKVDKCGHKIVPLIVGGEFAKPREFPHMALIGFQSGETISWECGGTLLSDEYVLTAGHCTKTKLYGDVSHVRLGELDRNSETDDARPEDFEIAQIINHPEYKASSRYNDIALLRLSRKVTLNPYKRPACLPTEFDGTEQNVIATGWGQTEWSGRASSTLQKVTLEKFSQAECNESYVYEIDRRLSFGIVDETQVCAGSRNEIKDTCQGDSGGPIQTFYTGVYCMYKVVGVTSFGIACGNPGTPGVYTRVYAYRDWIENIVWGNQ